MYFLFILFACPASADFSFNQLTSDEIKGASRDFAALVSHTTVSPASSLIKRGFEFGLIAGTSSIPNIERATARSAPNTATESKLPNAGLIGIYSYSKKLTFEVKIIPEIQTGAVYAGSQSLGVKLTFSDPEVSPWVTALRLQLTNAYMNVTQEVTTAGVSTPVEATTKFTSISYGAAALLGYRAILDETYLIEPFIGGGVIQAQSKYEVLSDTTSSLFATGSTAEGSKETGQLFMLGIQWHMFYGKLGMEYSRVFDSDKVTLKVAFGY